MQCLVGEPRCRSEALKQIPVRLSAAGGVCVGAYAPTPLLAVQDPTAMPRRDKGPSCAGARGDEGCTGSGWLPGREVLAWIFPHASINTPRVPLSQFRRFFHPVTLHGDPCVVYLAVTLAVGAWCLVTPARRVSDIRVLFSYHKLGLDQKPRHPPRAHRACERNCQNSSRGGRPASSLLPLTVLWWAHGAGVTAVAVLSRLTMGAGGHWTLLRT